MAAEEPPLPPMFAFVKTPRWERVDDDAQEAFAELVEHLGDRVEEVELLRRRPTRRSSGTGSIMDAEMAANLEREWETGRDRLSAPLRAQLERGREVRALDYLRALAAASRRSHESFAELFEQRYDAILTPAAPGTAPAGLELDRGSDLLHAVDAAAACPRSACRCMQGANGLPLGVQLVGPRHGDARLLRTARWLVARVAAGLNSGRTEPP